MSEHAVQAWSSCVAQGVPDAAGADPNWDMLNYPYSSCVSYKKDLSPLQYGDKVSTGPQLSLVVLGHFESFRTQCVARGAGPGDTQALVKFTQVVSAQDLRNHS